VTIAAQLKARIRISLCYRALRFVYRVTVDGHFRSVAVLKLRRSNLLQPANVTCEDRYPRIFRIIRDKLGSSPELRLLSFGCSTGEEVFTLRQYFPNAEIKGIDINPRNIAICMVRLRSRVDERLSFRVGESPAVEETESYDAIFCMAVLRHGGIGGAPRCDHLIRFSDYERIVSDLARCVRVGGYLIMRHSNFRFDDTEVAARFDELLRMPTGQNPTFDRGNCRVEGADYEGVIFCKREPI
jgi:2-polyprenyl-3-methyl-5-hydroxy-6-metoxy-1,4-benzoquinol methylase